MDEDILSQVLGKDTRGRSRAVGSIITKMHVKACAIAQKRFKHVREDNDELKTRVGSLEGMMTDMKGTVGNLSGKMEVLINMVGTLTDQGTQAPLTKSDGGRSSTHISASKGVPSPIQDTTNAMNNQRCEILNSDLDIIATCMFY